MRSILVFCLLLATNLQALKAKDKIQVEDVYVPTGFCQRPQVNDHVTVDYNFKMEKLTERWALKIQQYKNLEIRLIGPLQTNKVTQALDLFDVIETIDREKLAKEIANKFSENVKTKNFYIQINTGSEIQKSGIEPLQSDSFIKYCKEDLRLPVVGLMCIPPLDEEPAMHFALLKKIAERNNLKELSMGMSNDFEIAIEEGATMIRIGSAIFGARNYG